VCVGYFFWFQVDKILHLSLLCIVNPTEKIENVRKKKERDASSEFRGFSSKFTKCD